MKHPGVTSIETALRIYYACPDLRNKEIMELFGVSDSTARRLRRDVQIEMPDSVSMRKYAVNTAAAYKVWAIDIADLEHRYKKINQLKLTGGTA